MNEHKEIEINFQSFMEGYIFDNELIRVVYKNIHVMIDDNLDLSSRNKIVVKSFASALSYVLAQYTLNIPSKDVEDILKYFNDTVNELTKHIHKRHDPSVFKDEQ